MIEEIRAAHNERNPIQPGAGATLDNGGLDDSGTAVPIAVRNGQMHTGDSYDFVQGLQVSGVLGVNDISCVISAFPDMSIQGNNCSYQTAFGSFESITTAPVSGYAKFPAVDVVSGTVLIFKTDSGKYGKMKIVTVMAGLSIFTFDYAVQTDGSTSIKT